MKILITGGAGFIGSHVVDLLIEKGNEVVVIDNLSSGKMENLNKKAKFYQEDIGNYEKVWDIFEKERPEVVYHFAAQINVRKSVENPVEDAMINVIYTIKLLEICVKYKIKHFIFSSTGGVMYGNTKEIPTKESLESPICPYGCAKLSVEKYLNYYWNIYGLKFTVLRYSNVYGPRQNPHGEAGVISIFLEQMFAGKPPVIFGGIQKRDFVYVRDVAYANLLALNEDKSDVYNVSTGKETDIIEVFNKLNKYFKNKFEPKFSEMKKGEQLRSCLDYGKIKESLGWYPKTSLDEGFDKTYCWFLKQKSD